MSYGKLDDQFPFHAKTIAAGNAAVGAFLRMVAWSNAQLTDGFIPSEIASMIGTKSELKTLESVRFLERKSSGFQVHDFLDHNDSAATVRAKRQAAKDRQAKARSKDVTPHVTPPVTRDDTRDDQRDDTRDKRFSRARAPAFSSPLLSSPSEEKEESTSRPGEAERPSGDPIVVALNAEPLLAQADPVGAAAQLRAHGVNSGTRDPRWLACIAYALDRLRAKSLDRPVESPMAYVLKIAKSVAPPRELERAIAERETPLDRRNGEPAPKKREPFRALQKPVWDDEL